MTTCLNGAKFTMTATLLKQNENYSEVVNPGLNNGEWVDSQNPLTGQIERSWVPIEDDPATTTKNETSYQTIKCVARGYSSTNRFTSNQSFGDQYKSIDVVRMWIPANVYVDKGDRITGIKDSSGQLVWSEYPYEGSDLKSVTFNVMGATPQFGPFNVKLETLLILERAEI